jgi:hypothetical protein
MFRIEWTPHQPKPQADVDEIFAALQESIEVDGPTDFAVLVSAAQLLETEYVLATCRGFGQRVLRLGYADIVDLFESMGAALEPLRSERIGVLEFYCGPGDEWPVFEADADEVRLFLVPWLEASGIDLSRPLPDEVKDYPAAVAGRTELIGHLEDLRRSFARSVVAQDPRYGRYDPIRRWLLADLSPRQRDLVESWLPGVEVEADMSWGLVETTVLRSRVGGRVVVVKAGGASDRSIEREIRAHREWTGPWVERGRAGRMLHADVGARLLVTEYLPGRLVLGTAAAAEMDTYVQAGELLRDFHAQGSFEDPDYESRMNAKALAWLAGPHRIAPEVVETLREMVRSWPPVTTTCVPTHGDWQSRNWLIDDGVLRVIDFGRAELRPAAEDFERLAFQEFVRHPGAEAAFLSGYGEDPRVPDAWFRQRVRSAIGTAGWAFQIGDQGFEAQGHRMIAEVLAEAG